MHFWGDIIIQHPEARARYLQSSGHAGTIVEGKEDTATEKISRLEAAGIPVVERIDEIPDAVKAKLGANS